MPLYNDSSYITATGYSIFDYIDGQDIIYDKIASNYTDYCSNILNTKIDITSNELQNQINVITPITTDYLNYSNMLSKHIQEYYTPTLIGHNSNLLIKADSEIKFSVNSIENLRINQYDEIEQYIAYDAFRDGIEYILLAGQAGQWVSIRKLMLEKAKTDLQNTFNDITGEVADIVQTGAGTVATQLAGFGGQVLEVGGAVGLGVATIGGAGVIATATGDPSKNDYKLVINTVLKSLTNLVNKHETNIETDILPNLVWIKGTQYIAYDDLKIMASDLSTGSKTRIRIYKTQTNLLFNPYLNYYFAPNYLVEDNSLNNRHFSITTVAGTADPISVFNVRNAIQIYDSGSYLTLPTADWSQYPDLTISFWIYASGLQGIPEIFSFTRGATTEVRFYRFGSYATLAVNNTQRWISSSTWTSQFNNKWVHVIICLRQTANTSQGFIKINNGTAETFTTSALPSATYVNKIGASLGFYQGTSYYFQLAQFGIFTTALSSADHTFLYTNTELPYTTLVDDAHTHSKNQIIGLNDYFQPHPSVSGAIYYGGGNISIGTYPTNKWTVPSKLTIYGDLEIVNGGLRQNGQSVVGLGSTSGSGTTGILSTSIYGTENIPISAVEFLQSTLNAKADVTYTDTLAPYTYVDGKISDTSNYVSTTSNLLQNDINTRALASHTHIINDISGLSQEFINSSNYTLSTSNNLIANREPTLILGDGLYKGINKDLNTYWKYDSTSGNIWMTNSGAVGIGATTATSYFKLYVEGATYSAGGVACSSSGGIGISWQSFACLGMAVNTGDLSTSASAGDIVLKADSTNKVIIQSGSGGAGLVIDTANNVGIGTNAPVRKFHLHSTATASSQYIQITDGTTTSSSTRGCLLGKSGNQDFLIYNYQAGRGIYFNTSPTTSGTTLERMRIEGDGSIGIGNPTTASNPLHVVGDVYSTTNFKLTTSTNTSFYWDGTNSALGRAFASGSYSSSASAGDIVLRSAVKLHLQSGTGASALQIDTANNVGFGIAPVAKLHVASGSYNTGSINQRYFNYGTALTQGALTMADVCGVFDSSIWVKSYIASSSDARIKKEINDINDDNALQKLLAIQPKTYKYIDNIANTSNIVYGFIAQQIAEVIPDAVSIKEEIIPNIYNVVPSSSNIIYMDTSNYILSSNLDINLITLDGTRATYKIQEYTSNSITVDKDLNSSNVFAYGYAVNDFHSLNKDYIFTLNVCATQQLYNIIQEQSKKIQDLENKLALL